MLIFFLFLCFSSNLHAEALQVTPYRPTVSNPAELSALNHFELEFGAQLNQPGMSEERTSLPFLLKYPFLENWGVMVGGEAWVRESGSDGKYDSFGNTSLLVKYYYPFSDTLAIGVEAGPILPSAKKPIGSGRTDWMSNLIISKDIDDLRIDLNVGAILQGSHQTAHDDFKYNWALAASHPLINDWGIAGEFSGYLGPDQLPTSQWLMTLNYMVNRLLVVDFGGSVGLTTSSDDYGVFAGFAFLFDP